MRLINTRTLEVEDFVGEAVPRYAILSHTWGRDEASLRGWIEHHDSLLTSTHAGYAKVNMARGQALTDGIEYLWVDTVCIDKSSFTEVSEAINAMFVWYRKAYVCYAYLSDVGRSEDDTAAEVTDMIKDFCRSRWFTRGWTLQELLAPARVNFYSRFWTKLGTKHGMASCISRITGIDEKFLRGAQLWQASVARRMSWMARRATTRPEDLAYSMMGIFDVNMPLLYGEGRKAFMRLQAEIVKQSSDETLFCWSWNEDTPSDWGHILAPAPSNFAKSGLYQVASTMTAPTSCRFTNTGVKVSLAITTFWTLPMGVLNALGPNGAPVGMFLAGNPNKGILWRASYPPGPVAIPLKVLGVGGSAASRREICILSRMPQQPSAATACATPLLSHVMSAPPVFKYAVMVSFSYGTAMQAFETVPAGMLDAGTGVLTLQRSSSRNGFYGAIIRLQVPRFRHLIRLLLAVNASDRPCWYLAELAPDSSSVSSSASSSRASSRSSNSDLAGCGTDTRDTSLEDLESHLGELSARHAVRGTKEMRRPQFSVSLGRLLRMPDGGWLRVMSLWMAKDARVYGPKR